MLSFFLVKDDYFDSFFFSLKKRAFPSVLRVFLTFTFCVLAKRFVFDVKMPTKKTVDKWEFKALGYKCNKEG